MNFSSTVAIKWYIYKAVYVLFFINERQKYIYQSSSTCTAVRVLFNKGIQKNATIYWFIAESTVLYRLNYMVFHFRYTKFQILVCLAVLGKGNIGFPTSFDLFRFRYTNVLSQSWITHIVWHIIYGEHSRWSGFISFVQLYLQKFFVAIFAS